MIDRLSILHSSQHRSAAAVVTGLIFAIVLQTTTVRAQLAESLYIADGSQIDIYNMQTSQLSPDPISVSSPTGLAFSNFTSSATLFVGTGGGSDLINGDASGILQFTQSGAPYGTGVLVNYEGNAQNDVINPSGMRIGPNGDLFVTDLTSNNIHIYNSITGASLGNMTGTDISGPEDLTFNSAGNLYVAGGGIISVADAGSIGPGQTFSDLVSAGAVTNFTNPAAITIGSDGKIYAADISSDLIFRFDTNGTPDGLNGNSNGVFADLNSDAPDGEFAPADLAFDPAGNLYVSGTDLDSEGEIVKYAASGSYDGVFLDLGQTNPGFIAFVPEPATWILPLLVIALAAASKRRKASAANCA